MLVKIFSGAVNGIEATTITLEVNILNGAKFIIVGLPDNAVKESQQRIDSALRGDRFPDSGQAGNHQYGSCRCQKGRLCL